MLSVPDDPSARGPWDVGVRTVKIGRLTTEVVYPAQPGSTAGKPEATYDIRDWLPASERSKVPADHSPAVGPIGGHFYRDVPIDAAHGPYPVVIFIHGTASMRIASGSINATWASRGFVVLAADYPGMFLADILCNTPGCTCTATGAQDVPGDVTTQLNALRTPTGDLSFLASHVDTTRVGVSGHSQGGCIAAQLSTDPNVQVVIPMSASFPVTASTTLKSLMFVAGQGDTVIGYNQSLVGNWVCPPGSTSDTGAYQASPGPPKVKKRLVGIAGGGHLVPTDLCQKNAQGNNAIQEAHAGAVCGIDNAVLIGLPALFDCGTIDWQVGVKDVTYASTAALEETLMCKDRSAQFSSLKTNNPTVGEFQEMK
jgi:pimeloyl-ACP methyl ester carboxylesterase